MDHDQTLAQIMTWAGDESNIRVLVLTGSAALGGEALHPLSDLDVELYVEQPDQLLDDDSWFTRFGEVLVVEALPNPGWHPTRLVIYAGGKVDFMVAPVSALATTTYSRPFRILVDKDGLTEDLEFAPEVPQPPDRPTFLRCQHWFHTAALMCARAVARDEPWQAKDRDHDLKAQLLQMIEWDHRARHGWSYETWFRGKHLTRWVDQDVQAALAKCWGTFALPDIRRALLASVGLFEGLSERTAAMLGLAPFDASRIRDELSAILALADTEPVHGDLVDLTKQLMTAVQQRDLVTLDTLLGEDFTLTTGRPGNEVRSRAEWLHVTAHEYVVEDFEFEELVVQRYGSCGVVRSRYRQRGRMGEQRRNTTYRMTDTWVHMTDGWKLQARHAQPLAGV